MKIFNILFLIFIGSFLVNCGGPRSATMCYKPGSEWVKCPAGYYPGDTLEYDEKGKLIQK